MLHTCPIYCNFWDSVSLKVPHSCLQVSAQIPCREGLVESFSTSFPVSMFFWAVLVSGRKFALTLIYDFVSVSGVWLCDQKAAGSNPRCY